MRTSELPATIASRKPDYTQQDLRETTLWKDIDKFLNHIYEPSIDKINNASELAASPDGKRIAFTGTIHGANWRDTPAKSKICIIDVETNALNVITSGTSSDNKPKWAPDGNTLAFLSDRTEEGIFQLYLLEIGGLGEAKSTVTLNGTVEDFHWSPDGCKILLQVAGRGADKGDAGGSGKVGQPKKDLPTWMPTVDSGDLTDAWRSLWVYFPKEDVLQRVSDQGTNPWEATWVGSDAIASISSDSALEDSWYMATLRVKSLIHNSEKVIYKPKRQLGGPVSNPSGTKIAFIEAVASDRGLTWGDVKIIDSGNPEVVAYLPTNGVDVSQLIWRDDYTLFYIGLRGLEVVAGQHQHPEKQLFSEWKSQYGVGRLGPAATLLPDNKVAVVLEGWSKPPEITLLDNGTSKVLHSFSHKGYKSLIHKLGPQKPFTWKGSDGLELQGFLNLPKKNSGKTGLIVSVHGGPVFAHTNSFLGFTGGLTPILNAGILSGGKGYAIFRPNPRGSGGRGQKFAEQVLGDMGGLDAQDILLGIKAVAKAYPDLIDSEKIGVEGGSYGGYMASLLPTLDPCFKASVSMAAVTDWHSFHTTSNIPTFDQLFLDADPYSEKGGKYLTRSPVMNAGKYKTPVLQTAGADDLAVPSSQGLQYHQALLEKGVESAIAIYPGEGHGVQKFPAVIDLLVRAVGWFEKYMPV
jgi:dipeptidyl aminopeptidase/acylaminoacyl peptidase